MPDDDGTVIVEGGEVVAGDPVAMATVNFLASGGDCWPLGDIEFANVGTTYQRALANHVQNELGGSISAADYPEADTRIVIVGGTGGDDGSADDGGSDEPLPMTGGESLPIAIGALGLVAAGAMLVGEARRTRRY